jgi:signal transduction histidine kinase
VTCGLGVTLYITAAPNFNQDTFDRAIERIQDGRRELVVDLRRCIFVDAYALVSLTTVITLACEEAGYTVTLRLPVRQSARTYFARMRFFDLLPEDVLTDGLLPAVTERGAYLMPLTRLNVHGGEQAVEDLANFVWPQLPLQLAERFTGALAEIASNVVAHSGSTVGFVAGQRYDKAYQGRLPPRLHLVVGDAGIGIRASLAAALSEVAQMSEVQAVRYALTPGVTAKPSVHSGVGLSTVRDYARYFGGVMRLRSGGASVVLRPTGEKAIQVPRVRGTVVSVELSSPGRRGGSDGS